VVVTDDLFIHGDEYIGQGLLKCLSVRLSKWFQLRRSQRFFK
jgi:hypothetical protein